MKSHNLKKRFFNTGTFRKFLKKTLDRDNFSIKGISGSSLGYLLAGLSENNPDGQTIVVVPDYRTAEQLHDDLETITGNEINNFAAYRGIHLEEKQINTDIRVSRLKCLLSLYRGMPGIYIVEIRSLLHPIIHPADFKNRLMTIKTGGEMDYSYFVELLIEEGFDRVNMVEEFGEISVRGSIVDVFPPTMLEPVRVEFYGDTIESIRVFDINDQLSQRQIDHIDILPPISDTKGDLKPHIPEKESTVLSYFKDNSPVLYCYPEQSKKVIAEYCERWKKENTEKEQKISISPQDLFNEIEKQLSGSDSAFIRNSFTSRQSDDTIDFNIKNLIPFNRNLKLLKKYIDDIKTDFPDLFINILCDNKGQADRLKELILEEDIITADYRVQIGSLSGGFNFAAAQIIAINDHEIFGRKHLRKVRKVYRARKVLLDDLSLKIGDYVVHDEYGIGRYEGLHKITVRKSRQEALKIAYRDGDTLYLNIEKLPRLEKYKGKEGFIPELSKIGGADWDRLKKKTKKALENITRDLIEIYAKRASRRGFAFSPDTQWQGELEASFLYDETPDQLKTSFDVKRDMESINPMDRLVCGDVGYGKTEIAVRAAFKAVNDNKQAVVLVPTTILAQQHLETFRERFASFPVNIEMLSRFRTKKEQLQIVNDLEKGLLDIVIGTHRLLSKDVLFKDLGLVVIDEEQRFGVKNKEKLKKLRAEVDVLTMTATPIPRTLHMSLLGIRDLSMINTPPKNRLPIITEISEYDEELIRAAIMKELDRGGQVYFVHNRVQTIQKMFDRLRLIVPESSFKIAHGQMREKELEKVMLSFLAGDFSCLVSTMIIESGLDIPSVNTIIINKADHFGLAQLYQLRGRVGRSDVQAFAYFLTPPFETMTDLSIKRLQTLSEHTELGSGLQIAMQDLEIRGAGNLIGREQSGHINNVGYDMYTKLIKESIAEQLEDEYISDDKEKLVKIERFHEIKFDSDISAYLPDDYVPDPHQRVSLYRKLASIDSYAELQNMQDELKDRFGPIPSFAENILKSIRIKFKAAELNIERIQIVNNKFSGTFFIDSSSPKDEKEHLVQLISKFVEKSDAPFRIMQEEKLKIELPLIEQDEDRKLDTVLEFLESLIN
ncbi:transcription-repair coupling factor [candidate division KSB1 bacterium]